MTRLDIDCTSSYPHVADMCLSGIGVVATSPHHRNGPWDKEQESPFPRHRNAPQDKGIVEGWATYCHRDNSSGACRDHQARPGLTYYSTFPDRKPCNRRVWSREFLVGMCLLHNRSATEIQLDSRFLWDILSHQPFETQLGRRSQVGMDQLANEALVQHRTRPPSSRRMKIVLPWAGRFLQDRELPW